MDLELQDYYGIVGIYHVKYFLNKLKHGKSFIFQRNLTTGLIVVTDMIYNI